MGSSLVTQVTYLDWMEADAHKAALHMLNKENCDAKKATHKE